MTAATAGLILAAGAGSRFGDTPKQLADLHGRPLLQWAVDAQTAVDAALLSPIVVVLGSRAAAVAGRLAFGRARVVVCEEWERGQAWSLRRGLRALEELGVLDAPEAPAGLPPASAVLVTLGDAPLLRPEVVARFAGEDELPVRALYDGRPGHPVVLGPREIAALRGADGDRGARALLRDARTIEVGHLCSGRDVDTPQDLEEVRDEARAVV